MSEDISAWQCYKPDSISIGGIPSKLCVRKIPVEDAIIKIGVVNRLTAHEISRHLDRLLAVKDYYGLDVLVIRVSGEPPNGIPEAVYSRLGLKIVASRAGQAREEVRREKVYTLRFRLSLSEAEELLKTKIKSQIAGGLVGALTGRKVELLGVRRAYMPIRCYIIVLNRGVSETDELAFDEGKICLELATGSLVMFENNRLVVNFSYYQLGEIDDTVLEVYEMAGARGEISLEEVAEHVGSLERANAILQLLTDLGLLEPVGMDMYRPVGPSVDTRDLVDIFKDSGLLTEGEPECGTILGPGVDIEKLDRLVRVWGSIRSTRVVYYPIYVGVYRKYKGSSSIEVAVLLDGVSGRRMDDFEELIASSRVVYTMDELITEVVEGKPEQCGVKTKEEPGPAQ